MKLNCAILHQDAGLQDQLMKYIEKVPFLCCCGAYNNALEALKAYYEKRIYILFRKSTTSASNAKYARQTSDSGSD